MNIGKREKMIIGGVIAALLMGGLHFMLFKPRAEDFLSAQRRLAERQGQLQSMRTIQNEAELETFNAKVTNNLDLLTSGVTALGFDIPDAFKLPTLTDDFAVPLETRLSEIEPFVLDELNKAVLAKVPAQVDLILAEISQLIELARQAAPRESTTKLTFLAQPTAVSAQPISWWLPTELPPQIRTQPDRLWNGLSQISSIKFNLDDMNPESPAYEQTRFQYRSLLFSQLAINYDYVESTSYFGTFVPMIVKMALAQLILEQLAEYETASGPVLINNRRLDRDMLFRILDIRTEEYGLQIEGMRENKLYFMFEGLRGLNRFLQLAVDVGLAEVSFVAFDGHSYLRTQTVLEQAPAGPINPGNLSNDEFSIGQIEEAVPEFGSGFMEDELDFEMEMMMMEEGEMMMDGEEGEGFGRSDEATLADSVNRPKEDELGLAMPMKMIYSGSNDRTWKYLYDVLRTQPLTELHRLSFMNMSQYQPNNTNVQTTVTFIVVPQLFTVIGTVENQLRQLAGGGQGPVEGPGGEAGDLDVMDEMF